MLSENGKKTITEDVFCLRLRFYWKHEKLNGLHIVGEITIQWKPGTYTFIYMQDKLHVGKGYSHIVMGCYVDHVTILQITKFVFVASVTDEHFPMWTVQCHYDAWDIILMHFENLKDMWE